MWRYASPKDNLRSLPNDVQLFETAPGSNEAGAAICVSPNAAIVMSKLGIKSLDTDAVRWSTVSDMRCDAQA
jgi:2-polyprenyl-6-methoxyphenol hydroxylase-like FAD-dependent oxidoreductase